MTKNSARKRATRKIMEETGLSYTQAAVLADKAHAAANDLRGPETSRGSVDAPAG